MWWDCRSVLEKGWKSGRGPIGSRPVGMQEPAGGEAARADGHERPGSCAKRTTKLFRRPPPLVAAAPAKPSRSEMKADPLDMKGYQ